MIEFLAIARAGERNMLASYVQNLQGCIQWASLQEDMDVLCLARERMQELEQYVSQLPVAQQQSAYLLIDDILPMEWPLWMETCRYEEERQMGQHLIH
jgi:hypothetical protein